MKKIIQIGPEAAYLADDISSIALMGEDRVQIVLRTFPLAIALTPPGEITPKAALADAIAQWRAAVGDVPPGSTATEAAAIPTALPPEVAPMIWFDDHGPYWETYGDRLISLDRARGYSGTNYRVIYNEGRSNPLTEGALTGIVKRHLTPEERTAAGI